MPPTSSSRTFLLSLFALVCMLGSFAVPRTALASPLPITGWAWGGTDTDVNGAVGPVFLGSIGFSASNCGGYGGVSEDSTTGALSGYACADKYTLGWISFNTSDGTHPAPKVDLGTGKITGWIRACAAFRSGCSGALDPNSGGWDGWIALSDPTGTLYGVTQNLTTSAWSGYAWGSDVIGYIYMTGVSVGAPSSLLSIAVSPTSYSVTLPSSTVSTTYTLTNGTSANTNCRLLDSVGAPLNAYASCSGTMSVTAPTTPDGGTYGYSIQANKSSTGETVTSNSFTVTVNPAVLQPTLSVSCSASPTSAIVNKDPVTWTAIPSGGTPPYSYSWSGSSPLGGKTGNNPVTVIYSTTGTKTGSVKVTSGSQTSPSTVCSNSVDIKNPLPLSVATLTATPSSINKGDSSTLTWTSTNNATRCDSPDFSTNGLPSNTSSDANPDVLVSPTTNTTYSIYCTNANGVVGPTTSATVTVIPVTVSIKASPTCINGGGNSKISWSATPANLHCDVLGPGLSRTGLTGAQLIGSQIVPITAKSTYTIACTTNAGSTVPSKSVIVDVSGCWSEF